MPVLGVTVPLMDAVKTSRSATVWRWKQDCFQLACSSLPGPARISRLVLMLLDTMSMGGPQEQGAGEISVIPPSEMHSVCPRILSWSWLNNPMTLDVRSRVSDISVLVVEHAQMFAKGVAEDLQLYHRLHVGRPAQHATPGCPIPAGSVEPHSLSHKQILPRQG